MVAREAGLLEREEHRTLIPANPNKLPKKMCRITRLQFIQRCVTEFRVKTQEQVALEDVASPA
jgi:hypothetical protein